MHLVHDDQCAVTLRGPGHSGQFGGGMDDSGRVVRAAQEQHGATRGGIGRVRCQGPVDRSHVQPPFGGEGDRHHLPTDLPGEAGEGRIDRTRDHHGAPGRREPLDQDPDPGHHVGAECHVSRVRVPVPADRGELRQCLLVGGPEVRVPGITSPDGLGQGLNHLRREEHIHLRHPHRQDVRTVVLPLDRRAAAELLWAQDLERGGDHAPIVTHPTHWRRAARPRPCRLALHLSRSRVPNAAQVRVGRRECSATARGAGLRGISGGGRRAPIAGRRGAGPAPGGRGARACHGR